MRLPNQRKALVRALSALLLCLTATAALAETPRIDGWILEPGVDVPGYAVTGPVRTNLNVDTIALVCEEGGSSRILQLKLYLSDAGRLMPKGASEAALKRYPGIEIVIDERIFPARLYFADDYVLVADTDRERIPTVSEVLLDAMARGVSMTVRFDLVEEWRGQPATFDSEVVVNLQAGRGGQAVNAVRRCAVPAGDNIALAFD